MGPRKKKEIRFLADEMLARLGRWLRAAGYDTLIANGGLADRDLLEVAIQEDRILVTRDHHFLELKKGNGRVVFLDSNTPLECARELQEKVGLSWTFAPFSRCTRCNTRLDTASDQQIERVPPGVRMWCTAYWVCPTCDRLYWLGTHTERMLKKLRSL